MLCMHLRHSGVFLKTPLHYVQAPVLQGFAENSLHSHSLQTPVLRNSAAECTPSAVVCSIFVSVDFSLAILATHPWPEHKTGGETHLVGPPPLHRDTHGSRCCAASAGMLCSKPQSSRHAHGAVSCFCLPITQLSSHAPSLPPQARWIHVPPPGRVRVAAFALCACTAVCSSSHLSEETPCLQCTSSSTTTNGKQRDNVE